MHKVLGWVVWLSQNTLFLQLLPLALAKKSGSVPPLQVGFLRQSQGSSFHPGLEWVIAGLLFIPLLPPSFFSYVYLYQSSPFHKVKKKIGKHRCLCYNSIWKPAFWNEQAVDLGSALSCLELPLLGTCIWMGFLIQKSQGEGDVCLGVGTYNRMINVICRDVQGESCKMLICSIPDESQSFQLSVSSSILEILGIWKVRLRWTFCLFLWPFTCWESHFIRINSKSLSVRT